MFRRILTLQRKTVFKIRIILCPSTKLLISFIIRCLNWNLPSPFLLLSFRLSLLSLTFCGCQIGSRSRMTSLLSNLVGWFIWFISGRKILFWLINSSSFFNCSSKLILLFSNEIPSFPLLSLFDWMKCWNFVHSFFNLLFLLNYILLIKFLLLNLDIINHIFFFFFL